MNAKMIDSLRGERPDSVRPWRTVALAVAASVGADAAIRLAAERLFPIPPDTLPLKWRAVVITALVGSLATCSIHAAAGRMIRNPTRPTAAISGALLALSFLPIYTMHRDTGARAITAIVLLRTAPPTISLALLRRLTED